MPDIDSSHTLPTGAAPDPEAITAALTQAVLAVPGVVRLEPSLLGRVGQWGGALLKRDALLGGQGLELDLAGTTAAVSVDIATAPTHRLRSVAEDVQRAVAATLAALGLTCTSVAVSVLTIGD